MNYLFNKSPFGEKMMHVIFIKFSGYSVSDFRYTITNWKTITETLEKKKLGVGCVV